MWSAAGGEGEMDAGFAPTPPMNFRSSRDATQRARGGRSLYGASSPDRTVHEPSSARVSPRRLDAPLDADHEERAIYVIDGTVDIAGGQVRGRTPAGVQAGR